MIRCILEDRICLGVVEQGKTYNINYEIKVRKNRKPQQWCCIENMYESIIKKNIFKLVQKMWKSDLRIRTTDENVYLFFCIVFCNSCREKLLRQNKTVREKIKSILIQEQELKRIDLLVKKQEEEI